MLSTSDLRENSKSPGIKLQNVKGKDNCWICEGWSEIKFDLRCKALGAEINIHFDFDDFKPDKLRPAIAGFYSIYRMVPPGNHKYFFSINGELVVN